MKSKEIASRYGFDKARLEQYILQTRVPHKYNFGGLEIDDVNVDALVINYRQYLSGGTVSAVTERDTAAKAVNDKQAALARMLITSGFNFDGYTITKYSGYISGDDAVQIDRGTDGIFNSPTNVGAALMQSLVRIRRNALAELKEAAYALGCNAVIGVDFDYLILDPETSNNSLFAQNQRAVYLPYVFGVTANGNAVIIERNARA
ncbi:MAG: heavy metal-binding domain-containing protein [Coriobacteriales bacterium]|jgi:uncharacterized protein YbjQ (UPF0145 family)|nr:heavy metal-binding domain-containing protein [Coriobacteriales bacterium]